MIFLRLTTAEAEQLDNLIKPIIFLSKQNLRSRCVLRLRQVARWVSDNYRQFPVVWR